MNQSFLVVGTTKALKTYVVFCYWAQVSEVTHGINIDKSQLIRAVDYDNCLSLANPSILQTSVSELSFAILQPNNFSELHT